jgi:hypothetical protein
MAYRASPFLATCSAIEVRLPQLALLDKGTPGKTDSIIAETDRLAIVAVLNDVLRKGGNCSVRRSPYNTVVIQIESLNEAYQLVHGA